MVTDRAKILLYAPAKINLFLHVLGRRPDGYHDLETWMQKIDLVDTVSLEMGEGDGIEFSCNDRLLNETENLAVTAAEAFFSALGKRSLPKLTIRLDKRIPVAAGLGGGSSNAGTVLRGLNILCERPFSETELVDLARPLGADVPFFVVKHNAVIAQGTGDIMRPVNPLNDCTFVLVNPGFFVSTRWVFENLSLTRSEKKYSYSRFHKFKRESLTLPEMHNDLELVTSAKHSEIEEMKQNLSQLGASRVLMSGSGATVFGVFPDAQKYSDPDFRHIASELCRNFGDKVFIARACTGAWPSG